jgi:uncharacterized protein YbjT (DUF2867 family)
MSLTQPKPLPVVKLYIHINEGFKLTAMKHQKTAIILGATGLTGGLLLDRLLADEDYTRVKLFSRKTTGVTSPKITEYVGDLMQLEQFREDFRADVVFVCIGTTSAKTRDRGLYHAIDYGIPSAAARLARESQIPVFMVMSSLGANSRSRIFYSRTKGEMEEAVLGQHIPHTYILRPSLILGERDEKRFGERLGGFIFKLGKGMLRGGLAKYRAIEAGRIADAMIALARTLPDMQMVPSDVIQKLGREE